MRIVVLYGLAGGGHLSAAKALKTHLEAKGCEVFLEDATKPFGRVIDFFCCDLYQFSAKYIPRAFGLAYRLTDRRRGGSRFMRFFAGPLIRRLLPVIEKHDPDLVVCVYPFSCQLAAALRAKGRLRAKIAHQLTDYGTHAAWVSEEADYYFASCRPAAEELERRGVPKEKICVTGIPVRPLFFETPDRAALRGELGLPRDKPVLLFMAGSFGVRSVLKIYRALDGLAEDFACVVITGKNEKLHRQFEKRIGSARHRTQLLLFTDRIPDYMHACDLLITKPGGLTTTEALASGIPLAVFDAIPGQEEDNTRFLLEGGMAVRLRSAKPDACRETVSALLRDPDRLSGMRRREQALALNRYGERFLSHIEDAGK